MGRHPEYVELRARSAFSFLEGASAPEDLADCAAAIGYDALALGDRDGVYGAPRFYQAATAAKIKAIVGAEMTIDEASFGLPATPATPARLYLLVPDRARYRNLCRMITASKLRTIGENKDGSPRYPAKGESRVTLEELERFGAGMICLAGGAMSPPGRMLMRGDDPRALCDRLGAAFGRGNLYLDLQRHLDPDEERLNRRIVALADACGLPIVATNGVCFTLGSPGAARGVSAPAELHSCMPADSISLDGRRGSPRIYDTRTAAWHAGDMVERALLDVMTCIRLGTTLEDAGRALWVNNERHLKTPGAMVELFRDQPGAIAATRAIAERCEFTLRDLGYRFPDYPLPPGETPDSYLRALTLAGARERWGVPDDRTRHQLEHELGIIAKLKLAGYFLIVWDIVQFCRENRIMAQGRGSAANSAVCYALGITAVDAVRMELLFERFLSEERGEWPDIDIDLPSGDQREKVIQYVYRRYGARGAAMTANVITYRTRSAIRETGKVLGFPPDQVDRLAKLNYVYEFQDQHDEFVELLRKGGVDPDAPRVGLLVEMVRRLKGLPRHLGQHSGGMVIGAGPLDEIVPLEPATMPGRVVIQWDKEDCADLGIIKIDLLGLGMLAALEEAIPLVRAHEGVTVDLAHLPADDPAVYEMLRRADTVGLFQVESRAQMATLPRMKPRTFYDLVVEVAIIRPGPIVGKMVHPYLDRRNGRAPVEYDHPSLEPILRRTLGVPLFQEQLLRMAMAVAGFSGGEAEELRRAMGFKRSTARMEKIELRMREGMARNGIAWRYRRPDSSFDHFLRALWVPGIARGELRVDRICIGVPEMPSSSGLFRSDAELLSPRLLSPGNSAERRAAPSRRIAGRSTSRDRIGSALSRMPRCAWDSSTWRGCTRKPGGGWKTNVAGGRSTSIADFAARVAPNKRELDALAYAGAFATFGMPRREALWQAAAVERDPHSLLAGAQPARQSGKSPDRRDSPSTANSSCRRWRPSKRRSPIMRPPALPPDLI